MEIKTLEEFKDALWKVDLFELAAKLLLQHSPDDLDVIFRQIHKKPYLSGREVSKLSLEELKSALSVGGSLQRITPRLAAAIVMGAATRLYEIGYYRQTIAQYISCRLLGIPVEKSIGFFRRGEAFYQGDAYALEKAADDVDTQAERKRVAEAEDKRAMEAEAEMIWAMEMAAEADAQAEREIATERAVKTVEEIEPYISQNGTRSLWRRIFDVLFAA